METQLWQQFAKQKNQKKPVLKKEKIVLAYPRVSSKKQTDGESLELQKEVIDEFCQEEKFTIEQYFGLTYESAKTDDRKEFNRMLAYAKKHHRRIYGIVVYTYDRFSRTGGHAITLIEELRDKYNIIVFSATEKIDITTPEGDCQKDNIMIGGKHENVRRKKKCIEGMKKKVKQGYWVSTCPIGYTNLNKHYTADKHEYVINEDGKLLQKAFEWKDSGLYKTDVQIAKKLTQLGLKINEKVLSRVFRNPFYCGKVVSNLLPGEVFEGKHPALVSEELFLRINGVFRQSKLAQKRNKENDLFPLKGFAKCDETGNSLTGYISRRKGRADIHYYKARQGHNKNASQLHEQFLTLLQSYQLDKTLVPEFKQVFTDVFNYYTKGNGNDLNTLKQNRGTIKATLDKIEERFVIGEIDRELYEKYSSKYKTELAAIEKEIIETESFDCSNLDLIINKAVDISENLSKIWHSGDYLTKQRVQYLVFPDGIRYDKKNDHVLTPKVNAVFSCIPLLTDNTKATKKGKAAIYDRLSHRVELVGVEPTSKHGINKLSTCLAFPWLSGIDKAKYDQSTP